MKRYAVLLLVVLLNSQLSADEPIGIGSRRELMIDDYLIDSMSDSLRLKMHRPVRRNVALVTDAPWEGNACAYSSLFHDGEKYRMYYTANHYVNREGRIDEPHGRHLCCAESLDGIHFTKPELGLVEFDGSKQNNIVLGPDTVPGVRIDPGHTTILKDTNPNCPPDARYKALVRSPVKGERGLFALKSADGFHFSRLGEGLIITDGYFDSENLAFWDSVRGEYRAYFRDFDDGPPGGGGIRGIKTATSPDFLTWSKAEWLAYPKAPNEHLYTNQIMPYARAPHIFIGFPKRYIDRGWVDSTGKLPGLAGRKARASASPRYGSAVSDALMMTSRDGRSFKRWGEALIRPGPSRTNSWVYGDNMVSWGILPTKSDLPDSPEELSIYAIEGYWTGQSQNFRRYSFRVDGFVSIQAPLSGGEFVTKPILFKGNQLEINYSTSAAGSIRVELQNAEGKSIPGHSLSDCHEVFGDEIDRTVSWKDGPNVTRLAGIPVRMRFVISDADLFSFRFRQGKR
ncbi:MAG: hypothetical protein O2820_21775 [Planctomycetota bacterium]|nr:hypothetical protein [Planctomycetota bacterium]MDA1251848.1 hypothetical protein [Planctomycetota bacterium]